ncbi:MAG: energy-coupling factor transporter ATPase [Chloroflexi bacterium]|nr:energy-coupling factor transporter ATPase [Chloroflexota bacterium]
MIEIQGLHHTYRSSNETQIDALQGIDLDINEGEFVAVVGANGSGKTTLARHLNGLLLPTRGRVLLDGKDTRDRHLLGAIRSRVAMVFQNPEDQIVATTVEDDVAFGPENLGLDSEEIGRRVRWALESVDMWALRDRAPHMLSAGQQQRVAVAGALALRPRYLVLDEATNMLNPTGRRDLIALLRSLHQDGVAVILITHSMSEAAQAERMVALGEGRIIFDGHPRTMFSNPDQVGELGLELPPVAQLAANLSRKWPKIHSGLLTSEELCQYLLPLLVCCADCIDTGALARVESAPSDEQVRQALGADDLRYEYLAGTPLAAVALNDVSLGINSGDVVALLGRTGSGKSTLLQLLTGVLRPDSGRVLVEGRAMGTGLDDRRFLRKSVGMLFQSSEDQLFESYVGDDVAFGPRQLGVSPDVVRERVRWAMDTVSLPFGEFKDRFIQSLSGGERRKAALAGVLALRPRTLLLDEPTAGLDPQSRRLVIETLQRLNREEGMTLVVATHVMEDAARLASEAIVLDRGQVVVQDTLRSLFASPDRLWAYGLEPPEVTGLMHRLREAGICVPKDVLSVETATAVLNSALSLSQHE